MRDANVCLCVHSATFDLILLNAKYLLKLKVGGENKIKINLIFLLFWVTFFCFIFDILIILILAIGDDPEVSGE